MTVRRRYMVYGIVVDSDFPLATVGEVVDAYSQASVRLELGTAEFFAGKARGGLTTEGPFSPLVLEREVLRP